MSDKVTIRRLPSGVPGLDDVLGGGIPEFSFNLIAGAPGCGKTTLAHQLMFGLASPERRALYFTVLGEPPLKMLRYQQQFSFFDVGRINSDIRFVNLAEEAMSGRFDDVLARIVAEVEAFSPGLVFVDSFRSVNEVAKDAKQSSGLQQMVQNLGMRLTGWQTTSFLVGEYSPAESDTNPVFTVADGLLWLTQSVHRNSMVRKLQIMKMRGQAQIPGLHTFRIRSDGVRVFPRVILGDAPTNTPPGEKRLSTGVPGLDEMLGGGVPSGYSMLVAGPAGSGKTILTTAFLAEGARVGENGVIAAFEKRPRQSHSRILDDLVAAGQLAILDTRALDLSIDETLHELTVQIERLQAKRVVIDSLTGFELALAPTFREDFRESLYRMVAVLTGMGVTVVMTSELEDRYTDLRFSPYGAAFLTDVIVVQRYIEIDSRLDRVMGVVKVRASQHDKALRRFSIDADGLHIGEALPGYDGLLSGQARRNGPDGP